MYGKSEKLTERLPAKLRYILQTWGIQLFTLHFNVLIQKLREIQFWKSNLPSDSNTNTVISDLFAGLSTGRRVRMWYLCIYWDTTKSYWYYCTMMFPMADLIKLTSTLKKAKAIFQRKQICSSHREHQHFTSNKNKCTVIYLCPCVFFESFRRDLNEARAV